ncbi:hypothetical protein LTS18_005156 [Coniosporium uncinatum]|uniref:Uncharacterized protein n=1 Tax=Coniosporium uncinatum TaxID=93489 RepID=A0ACC3DRS6_9PEZI|nr:hypothetical protein LTS18_005156 [Coniosporium uncinatum]
MAAFKTSQAQRNASLVPTEIQIAVALTVVKSKPDNISIRYIVQLRQHIRRRAVGESVQSETRQYIDGVAYWRGQFERAESEKANLETRITQLERRHDKLKAQVSSEFVDNGAAAKRKRDSGKDVTLTRPTKRAKAGSEDLDGDNTFDDDYDTLGNDSGGSAAVQHLYKIRKLYDRPELDAAALTYHLVSASNHLGTAVTTICRRYQQQQFDNELARIARTRSRKSQTPTPGPLAPQVDIGASFRAAGRSFMTLLHGLAKLEGVQDDGIKRRQGAIVHAYINTFSRLIDTVTTLCLLRAKHNQSVATASAVAHQDSQMHEKTKPKPNNRLPQIPQNLTTILAALFTELSPQSSTHRELLEGFLYTILERVGKRVYVLTFDRERSATAEGDILPPSKLGSASAGRQVDVEAERQALRLEAPLLMNLLERAMSLAPKFLGSPNPIATKSTGRTKTAKAADAGSKANLSLHIKEKLQQTLVLCMFGDEPNEFADLLRRAPKYPPPPKPVELEQEEVGDWFKEKVWKLVGWELLAQEGDW